jgi:hypothetical protein
MIRFDSKQNAFCRFACTALTPEILALTAALKVIQVINKFSKRLDQFFDDDEYLLRNDPRNQINRHIK